MITTPATDLASWERSYVASPLGRIGAAVTSAAQAPSRVAKATRLANRRARQDQEPRPLDLATAATATTPTTAKPASRPVVRMHPDIPPKERAALEALWAATWHRIPRKDRDRLAAAWEAEGCYVKLGGAPLPLGTGCVWAKYGKPTFWFSAAVLHAKDREAACGIVAHEMAHALLDAQAGAAEATDEDHERRADELARGWGFWGSEKLTEGLAA